MRRAEQDLQGRGGAEIHSVAADVRQEEQVRMGMEKSAAFSPRLDVLVNNARTISVSPLHAMTRSDFEEAMARRFWMQERLPRPAQSPLKRIVNIASFGGKTAVSHMATARAD